MDLAKKTWIKKWTNVVYLTTLGLWILTGIYLFIAPFLFDICAPKLRGHHLKNVSMYVFGYSALLLVVLTIPKILGNRSWKKQLTIGLLGVFITWVSIYIFVKDITSIGCVGHEVMRILFTPH